MIDIHAHILPGLDDGARDLETALQMARVAAADGIKKVIATPHVITGTYENSRSEILAAVNSFNQELRQQQIALEVLPGAEYRLEANLPQRLRSGEVLTLNEHTPYLLVELPAAVLPPDFERVMYEIQLQGVIPIIAHPERNHVIMEKPSILQELTARGILAQITATSVTGDFGSKIRQASFRLIKQGSVQILASDAHHHEGRRSPQLSAARAEIKKQAGDAYAYGLTAGNPSRIITGLDLEPNVIVQPRMSWSERIKNRFKTS